MKQTILLLTFVAPFIARSTNWTNFPIITAPQPNDTFLIGTTTTNEQFKAQALLDWTKTNANYGFGNIVSHNASEFQSSLGFTPLTPQQSTNAITSIAPSRTNIFFFDEFWGGLNTDGSVGLGWRGSGAFFNWTVSEANHPSVFRISTPTTTNSIAYLSLFGLVAGGGYCGTLDDFKTTFIFKIPDTNQCYVEIGMENPFYTVGTYGLTNFVASWFVGCIYTNAASNFVFHSKVGQFANYSYAASSRVADTNWHTLTLRTINHRAIALLSLDGEPEITLSANLPAYGVNALTPAFGIVTATNSKSLDIDYFDFQSSVSR